MLNSEEDQKRPHRVILVVEDVRGDEIDLSVPSWDPDHVFTLPAARFAQEIRNALGVGGHLLGDVNIGSESSNFIFIENIERIIEN